MRERGSVYGYYILVIFCYLSSPGARITGPVLDQLSDLVYLDLPVADLCLPKPRPVVGKVRSARQGTTCWTRLYLYC